MSVSRHTNMSLATASVLMAFVAEGFAQDPPAPPDPEHAAAVSALRAVYGRALSISDSAKKRAELNKADQVFNHQVTAHREDAKLVLELLELRENYALYEGDSALAHSMARQQQVLVRERLGRPQYDEWLALRVDRLRNQLQHDQAIFHLREAVRLNPATQNAAKRALLIGDIMLQRKFPDGPFTDAIAQYAQVASQYRSSFSDIADDARLRKAKALWINGQIPEAEALFRQLSTIANEAVAESARHYMVLPEILAKNAQQQTPPPPGP
ncbi:MAG: hypothetical protein JSU86_05590 [Phycisphaerales bacterium]|nr:MAG: hypothetical protein JSU86_05590 [Phycisphaerales bacterium]